MPRLPPALFLAAMLATAAFVVATTPALPPHVATHFGAAGLADGWMTRDGYRLFMLAFIVALPLWIVAALGFAPRLWPRRVNIPNRDYWLAEERREETLGFLLGHACRLGMLIEAFIAAMHYLLLAANAASPPRLSTPLFVAMLLGFLGGLGLWIAALYRRLRVNPPGAARHPPR